MSGFATSLPARARQTLLGVSADEALFSRRGFAATDKARQARLELCGGTFLEGYNCAIRLADPDRVALALDAVPAERRGFAFEGAGMGFALLDILAPWPRRSFQRFLTGPAAPHCYMVFVGAGWALARTSPRLARRLGPLDPLLRWLMFDGYGFHAGFFDPHRSVHRRHQPRALRGYALNAFDQGLGRAIWFVSGALVDRVRATVEAFPPERHGDLWSGVGLAAAYAGGVSSGELCMLTTVAGNYRTHLSQGANFAAKARARAGNPASQTELACQVFCCSAATRCATICDETLPSITAPDGGCAYEQWRAGIRRRFEDLSSEPAACATPDACFVATPPGCSSLPS
jgi:hypothetical protein